MQQHGAGGHRDRGAAVERDGDQVAGRAQERARLHRVDGVVEHAGRHAREHGLVVRAEHAAVDAVVARRARHGPVAIRSSSTSSPCASKVPVLRQPRRR